LAIILLEGYLAGVDSYEEFSLDLAY